MTAEEVADPKYLGGGRYECGLAPGSVCRPYLGPRSCRVVDECGCPVCSLWQARHNNPWDGFGAAL
ncbi:MAG: hypothetical protein PHF83_04680, partial [Candidatus Methanomethylophilus sp.]|nr:hypothetical protein [Methanomethylophilus sp.]